VTATKKVEIKEFARRVERLCDFFIGKVAEETGKDGSNDLKVIENLKEEAADIQFDRIQLLGVGSIEGLSDYMQGVASKEEN